MFGAAGFTDTPMWKPVGAPIACPPTSQPRFSRADDVGQADRVDVEDGGRVGIVADAPWIAGDEHEIAQPHRVRAEQIGLDAEQVPIAAGVVQQRLDAGLLLDQDRERQGADARAAAQRVGNVDDVDAANLELPRAIDHLRRSR